MIQVMVSIPLLQLAKKEGLSFLWRGSGCQAVAVVGSELAQHSDGQPNRRTGRGALTLNQKKNLLQEGRKESLHAHKS